MQTMTDIDNAEVARRQRAFTYERLVDEKAGLVNVITSLEKQANDAVKTLVKIVDLASQLPQDVVTVQVR